MKDQLRVSKDTVCICMVKYKEILLQNNRYLEYIPSLGRFSTDKNIHTFMNRYIQLSDNKWTHKECLTISDFRYQYGLLLTPLLQVTVSPEIRWRSWSVTLIHRVMIPYTNHRLLMYTIPIYCQPSTNGISMILTLSPNAPDHRYTSDVASFGKIPRRIGADRLSFHYDTALKSWVASRQQCCEAPIEFQSNQAREEPYLTLRHLST